MKNESGISLIEVLFALGVLTVVLTALTSNVLTALRNTDFSKNENLATSYAQEGLEIARQMRDSDYATFSSLSGHYCLASNCGAIGVGSGCGVSSNMCSAKNIGPNFSRDVEVLQNGASGNDCNIQGANAIKVVSTISWDDGKCGGTLCRTVAVTSCYSDYTVLPTP